MDSWALARSLLPDALSDRLEPYPKAEEIRLRTGRPPSVILGGRERVIDWQTTDRQLLLRVMEKATGASLHAAAPSLRNGFINYRGIRIGVCGEAVFTGGTMSGLRGFSSLAIRVPHTLPSGCEELIEGLITPKPRNTLIVSPPGVGKTSFLRELMLSEGADPADCVARTACVSDRRAQRAVGKRFGKSAVRSGAGK